MASDLQTGIFEFILKGNNYIRENFEGEIWKTTLLRASSNNGQARQYGHKAKKIGMLGKEQQEIAEILQAAPGCTKCG